jgi:hypothetical protein
VSPATATTTMELLVNSGSSILYRHTLSLPENTVFIDATNTIATNTGVIITPLANTSLMVQATSIDPTIPGGAYITGMDRHPIVAIARDGNIYVLDPTVALRYTEKNGYMNIEVVRGNILVASIEYRIDFFYTMK